MSAVSCKMVPKSSKKLILIRQPLKLRNPTRERELIMIMSSNNIRMSAKMIRNSIIGRMKKKRNL